MKTNKMITSSESGQAGIVLIFMLALIGLVIAWSLSTIEGGMIQNLIQSLP